FLRRLFYTVPVLFGVTLVCFTIFHWVGGDPAALLAGRHATPEQIQSIRQELGLAESLPEQYMQFLEQTITFEWGRSWQTKQNINELLLERVGPSLMITVPAFLMSFFICIALALFGVYRRFSTIDRFLTTACLALMSVSFLVYVIFFQYLIAFRWGLFPVNGWDSESFFPVAYLGLPWLISVIVSLGPNILIYRSALLDEVDKDYVRTAHAKGLSHFSIYGNHILKNALIPVVTILLIQIPWLVTGSLLLESFFSIPGVGGLIIQSIQNADFPVIKAMTVIGSLLYMFFNLVADFIYAIIDPRVSFQ
ncbi:MAG: ABC transporter permease, partial [Pseudomonadota bacterium]